MSSGACSEACDHHTTQHVINHAPVVGAYGLPAVAVAAPAVAVAEVEESE